MLRGFFVFMKLNRLNGMCVWWSEIEMREILFLRRFLIRLYLIGMWRWDELCVAVCLELSVFWPRQNNEV